MLGTSTRALRGQCEIVAKARRQRKEALYQRQVNEQEALGFGSTDATNEEYNEDGDDLPSPLEEAKERGVEDTKEVIFVGEEEVQGLGERIDEEAVPDQGAQQSDLPIEASPPLPLITDDSMIEDTGPTQSADTSLGATEATTGDEDHFMERDNVMIHVKDLYFDNQEVHHMDFPAK